MPFRRAFVLAVLAALALAGCGRKGPLELPPDVQAERAARQAAQQQAVGTRGGPRKLSEEGATNGQTQPQLGDIGRRPPDLYPFFLDPLL